MSESLRRSPLTEINRLIKENRVSDYSSPNLALGMRPLAFAAGTSRWLWDHQPPATLNPFGTIQGGYITVLIDEMLSTAIASVLEAGEWAMTAEFKVSFMRALSPGPWHGEAYVLRRTRALAFLETRITDPAGTIAVTATSTWAIAQQ
ncbi:MAG TPA: PaaI family thioesterase [Candidatus Binataceae bacterium]|nr:PaaI family thioesterase [Candidatus Binataceae bacterium]